MAKITTEFKCERVEHRQENEQIIILTPVASDSEARLVSEVKVLIVSEKDEFKEGCVYDLTISEKVKEKAKNKKELAKEAALKEEAENAEEAPAE
ncbi:hypothetical protein lotta81_gp025 [Flavobacterium phage vB_FspM_lotta8-1]|uniref:Uncharacterized protein n=3 Tax=Pippivirus TaxID=2843435 RepID=A0A6B9LAU9_9CAUD|nr:hypothetical protein HWC85_gp25 [Flavobacterium phage vB_FspM_lotta8-1]YP_009854556.1 hypothetical protein HWC86_gp25 [Flavobacterium phage vB_FspM_pippi8-1]QHB38483.1 hypothetical protein lotta81_gp025 [Flavobacterium phage vB_FspM_lotta8-1]QHB38536.1 hypothetical protein lotta82_gp025 [Flavobacterium phage vB_FspM_lotta8-2]QHB38589.1 hypothetical protein pippi81_gp025 [Flavobacterium phage vB_FspM_pippi8-1]